MRKLQEQGCKAAEIYISAGGNQDRAGEGKFLKAERAIFAEEPPQARRELPALPGGHPHVSGCGARGEELLSAVVNRLQRAAPRQAGRHGREAVGCCSRLSAAQRGAKKGFPTGEEWAEG